MHHLFFRVRANDVNSTKSQPNILIWWINKMTSDKRWQAKFSGIVSRWKQFLSFKNCCSVRICSVLNWSNQDTTVYYRLIFCMFSWPNMVKWRNSGIIKNYISQVYCMKLALYTYIYIYNEKFFQIWTSGLITDNSHNWVLKTIFILHIYIFLSGYNSPQTGENAWEHSNNKGPPTI